MADANVSRAGQANKSGDTTALFLKKFAGETILAFNEVNVFLGKTEVRTIDNGKSAQFPSSWKAGAAYHTPGTEITGMTVGHGERIISIDDLLIAPRFIADIDEAMAHYEVRGPYAKDVGRALSQAMDKNIAQTLINAARTTANITGAFGGQRITNASAKVNADIFIGMALDASQALDERDVPSWDRFIAVTPDTYYNLVGSSSKLIHKDYTTANGDFAKAEVAYVAGFQIVKTNNLPSTNVTTGPTAYQGDFTTTAAVAWHRPAVGTVKLIDLSVRMDYDPRRIGHLIVGKYACGHGVLRPECSVELATA